MITSVSVALFYTVRMIITTKSIIYQFKINVGKSKELLYDNHMLRKGTIYLILHHHILL